MDETGQKTKIANIKVNVVGPQEYGFLIFSGSKGDKKGKKCT